MLFSSVLSDISDFSMQSMWRWNCISTNSSEMSHWMLAVSSERLSLHNSTNKPAIYLPLCLPYVNMHTIPCLCYDTVSEDCWIMVERLCAVPVSLMYPNDFEIHLLCTATWQLHKYTTTPTFDLQQYIDKHDPIKIIFGWSVTEKVRNHTMFCFPASPI